MAVPAHVAIDCCCTLVDDADAGGDDWGLGACAPLVVAAGAYADAAAFRADYQARRRAWFAEGREVAMDRRLVEMLPGREALAAEVLAQFRATYHRLWRLTPGADAALATLRRAGVLRILVVSNHVLPGIVEEMLAAQGLRTAVDGVLSSADFGWKKPSPRIYAEACRRLGAAPEQVLFIGDNPGNDVRGPLAAGLQALLLHRGDLPGRGAPPAELPWIDGWAGLDAWLARQAAP
jgi:HAD superfamily hydrolase (TIGR01549 family)